MRKIFLIISICMLVLITSSCSKSSDSAKPATETVSYTVNDICGDYIDIISTKSLEVTEETMFFTNETKTSRVSEAWSIEGDEIILSVYLSKHIGLDGSCAFSLCYLVEIVRFHAMQSYSDCKSNEILLSLF